MNKHLWLFFGLVLIVLFSRLIPHPPNFTPIVALGLFIGAYSKNAFMWALPLLGVLLSDFILGFYHPMSMAAVYLGIILSAVVGKLFLFNKIKAVNVFGSSIGSAVIFFIVSNFGVWMSGQFYPLSLTGLTECYIAAIPFFKNTLISTVLYSTALFLIYEYIKNKDNPLAMSKSY